MITAGTLAGDPQHLQFEVITPALSGLSFRPLSE